MKEGLTRQVLHRNQKDRLTKKLHGRPARMEREPGKLKVKKKITYRVRAHDENAKLVFFKTRTSKRMATIRRFATLQGFKPDRIKT